MYSLLKCKLYKLYYEQKTQHISTVYYKDH